MQKPPPKNQRSVHTVECKLHKLALKRRRLLFIVASLDQAVAAKWDELIKSELQLVRARSSG